MTPESRTLAPTPNRKCVAPQGILGGDVFVMEAVLDLARSFLYGLQEDQIFAAAQRSQTGT